MLSREDGVSRERGEMNRHVPRPAEAWGFCSEEKLHLCRLIESRIR